MLWESGEHFDQQNYADLLHFGICRHLHSVKTIFRLNVIKLTGSGLGSFYMTGNISNTYLFLGTPSLNFCLAVSGEY